jgi:large subunit ribosomal protein L19e
MNSILHQKVKNILKLGNQFKTKTVLIEAIHRSKAEKIKAEKLTAQQEARRQKNLDQRKKKA